VYLYLCIFLSVYLSVSLSFSRLTQGATFCIV
jgi:hypothetical protein